MSKKPNINKHQKQNVESLTLTHQKFSGSIPPPTILEQYQKILPTAPERILSMAEKQQNHRHSVANQTLESRIILQNKGQIYGFMLILLVSFLSAYALFLGHEKFAIVGMVFVAVPLVKIFILGSKNH